MKENETDGVEREVSDWLAGASGESEDSQTRGFVKKTEAGFTLSLA